MNLTTVKLVREVLEVKDNPEAILLITRKVAAVSKRVEKMLDRHAEKRLRTELISVPSGTMRFSLKAYPVETIHRVWNDSGREFGIDDDTVSTTAGASASGQANITVADSTGFAAGDVIALGEFTARDEELTVLSVPGGTTITCTTNLTYTHSAAQADEVLVSPVDDCVDADYYAIIKEAGEDTGILWVDYQMASGVNALKVKYTGGMGTDVDDFETNYPDLAMAVAQQVAYEWIGRGQSGFGSLPGRDNATRQINDSGWLESYGDLIPELVQAINEHKRITL